MKITASNDRGHSFERNRNLARKKATSKRGKREIIKWISKWLALKSKSKINCRTDQHFFLFLFNLTCETDRDYNWMFVFVNRVDEHVRFEFDGHTPKWRASFVAFIVWPVRVSHVPIDGQANLYRHSATTIATLFRQMTLAFISHALFGSIYNRTRIFYFTSSRHHSTASSRSTSSSQRLCLVALDGCFTRMDGSQSNAPILPWPLLFHGLSRLSETRGETNLPFSTSIHYLITNRIYGWQKNLLPPALSTLASTATIEQSTKLTVFHYNKNQNEILVTFSFDCDENIILIISDDAFIAVFQYISFDRVSLFLSYSNEHRDHPDFKGETGRVMLMLMIMIMMMAVATPRTFHKSDDSNHFPKCRITFFSFLKHCSNWITCCGSDLGRPLHHIWNKSGSFLAVTLISVPGERIHAQKGKNKKSGGFVSERCRFSWSTFHRSICFSSHPLCATQSQSQSSCCCFTVRERFGTT